MNNSNTDYKKSKKFSKKATKGGESSQVETEVNDTFAHEPIQAQPLEVKVYHNNFDKALRAFRALVQKERILSNYKEKQSYEKPSDKNRRKRNEMRRKRLELDSPTRDLNEDKKSYKSNKSKYETATE
jgi:ribosomal protein S21